MQALSKKNILSNSWWSHDIKLTWLHDKAFPPLKCWRISFLILASDVGITKDQHNHAENIQYDSIKLELLVTKYMYEMCQDS